MKTEGRRGCVARVAGKQGRGMGAERSWKESKMENSVPAGRPSCDAAPCTTSTGDSTTHLRQRHRQPRRALQQAQQGGQQRLQRLVAAACGQCRQAWVCAPARVCGGRLAGRKAGQLGGGGRKRAGLPAARNMLRARHSAQLAPPPGELAAPAGSNVTSRASASSSRRRASTRGGSCGRGVAVHRGGGDRRREAGQEAGRQGGEEAPPTVGGLLAACLQHPPAEQCSRHCTACTAQHEQRTIHCTACTAAPHAQRNTACTTQRSPPPAPARPPAHPAQPPGGPEGEGGGEVGE